MTLRESETEHAAAVLDVAEVARRARFTKAEWEALQRLETRSRLEPNALIEEARDEDHPHHHKFEWDDSVAGHRYRLEQARQIIRSYTSTAIVSSRTLATPRYVRDVSKPPDECGYISQDVLKSEPEQARAFVRYELTRLAGNLYRAVGICEYHDDPLGVLKDLKRLHSKLSAVLKAAEAGE